MVTLESDPHRGFENGCSNNKFQKYEVIQSFKNIFYLFHKNLLTFKINLFFQFIACASRKRKYKISLSIFLD